MRKNAYLYAVISFLILITCISGAFVDAGDPSDKFIRSVMKFPNYRGIVFDNEKIRDVELLITLNPGKKGLALEDVRIAGKIKYARDGRAATGVEPVEPKDSNVSLKIPIKGLKPDDYVVEIGAYDRRNNDLIKTVSHELRIVGPGAKKPRVYIGNNTAIYCDGKPFFPLGWFTGNDPEKTEEIDAISGMGFNCVMNYGINEYHDGGSVKAIRTYLDRAGKRGVKVIYSLKDMFDGYKRIPKRLGTYTGEKDMYRGAISLFKDSRAVLMWYISDERPVDWIPRIGKHYAWARELDPDHPVWICQNRPEEIKYYLKVADILGVDPYPVPDKPLDYVYESMSAVNRYTKGTFPVIAVIQTHGEFQYGGKGRAPTMEEIRAMTYLALAGGAKGIMYYSYFDFRKMPNYAKKLPQMKILAEEIKAISPMLMLGEAAEAPTIDGNDDGIRMMMRYHEEKYYLIVVNANENRRKISMTLKRSARKIDLPFESRSVDAINGKLADELPPRGVRVYTWKIQ